METEIEAKFTDIDPSSMREKLKTLGAKQEHPEILMRRKVFDYPDDRLQKISGWVRVRDEGDKITFSYKQMNNRTLHGTKEVTVIVSDFEKTCGLLTVIGLEARSYQETKREKWIYNGTEVTIDTWPWIPPFVEIEGPDEASVKRAAAGLDFDWHMAMHGSVETVYQMHYDFTDSEIDHWPSITFIDPPDWLLARKK